MLCKWEVSADVNVVIKIQHILKTFIQPWEEKQMQVDQAHPGFFYEMFFKFFAPAQLNE